eukprot:1380166-Amorphochlora_amoeboformis.AAC.1
MGAESSVFFRFLGSVDSVESEFGFQNQHVDVFHGPPHPRPPAGCGGIDDYRGAYTRPNISPEGGTSNCFPVLFKHSNFQTPFGRRLYTFSAGLIEISQRIRGGNRAASETEEAVGYRDEVRDGLRKDPLFSRDYSGLKAQAMGGGPMNDVDSEGLHDL